MSSNNPSNKPLSGFDPFEIYNGPGFNLGEGDLFIGGNTDEVIGKAAAFMLMASRTKDGNSVFKGLTLIAPPKLVWNVSDEDILQIFLKGIEEVFSEAAFTEKVEIIRRMLTVKRCELLEVRLVVDAVKASGQNQLICIIKAAKYRDNTISTITTSGRTSVVIAEDEWVPHLASLASQCLEIARVNGNYLIIESPENPPARASNLKLLNDIDGLYPVYITYGTNPENEVTAEELVLKNSARWVGMAMAGRLEEALAEIEGSSILDWHKTQLAIQVTFRSENFELAAQLIRDEVDKGTKFPADIAIRFGRMAERGDDYVTAERLFSESISSISDCNLLESALLSATTIENADLVQLAFSRLISLFPDSQVADENCELRLMLSCQVTPNNGMSPPSRAGFTESNVFLADSLCMRADANYQDILDTFLAKWPHETGLASVCCALHALESMRFIEAVSIAVTAAESSRYDRQVTHILLRAIRRMMLRDVVPNEEMEFYKTPLNFVIKYLANNPADDSTRAVLAGLLSVESCGAIGLPMIASLALEIVQEGATVTTDPNNTFTEVSDSEFRNFYASALDWMESAPSLELGISRLPKEIVGDNPQGLIEYLTRLIRYATHLREEDTDLAFLEQCTHVMCLLAPHASDDKSDLEALRLSADMFWLEGQPQKARDFAEQILAIAGENHRRQRLAWASFSDIYQRVRSPIDALIGIACAAACDTEVELGELWQEAYTLLRITRDLGLYEIAKSLAPKCREITARQGLETVGNRRIDTVELGLRLVEVTRGNSQDLLRLLADIARHCEEVLEHPDELTPVATLLAQTIYLCESANAPVEEGFRSKLETVLGKIGPRLASFIRTISTSAPAADDVLSLHRRLDSARNPEDTAGDLITVVMAARRLLQSSATTSAVEDATLALELLAERSIESQEDVEITAEWPADYARKLSTEGVTIALLGLSEDGHLQTVIAQNGNLEMKHSFEVNASFSSRLEKWNKDYPYKYGLIDRREGNNEFYVSMAELDIPLPNTSPLLVIAEPGLQQIPMNLLLSEDEFIGRTVAIGTAPSLTWLEAARMNPATHDGRRLAWISVSDGPEEAGTLGTILSRLQPTLNEYGFHTDTSRRLPKNFSKAQMVIVCAHGGLTTEKRYIHTISDEGSLTESPRLLADALADVELVILFVCSGGRMDKHPHANTSVGLPKLLIDHGCRAVIASPWPLAAQVTYHWLDAFIKAWEAGDSILEATFKGNHAVQVALGDPPQYGLAMAVHGDVLLRRTHEAEV